MSPSSEPRLHTPGSSLPFDIDDDEFEAFRKLIYSLVGIQLNSQKKMLVISRLSRRLRQLGLPDFGAYLHYLEHSPDREAELVTMINQITTNKTDFFREPHHFDFLQGTLFPGWAERNLRNIRIWSAGCSTGEEPYTIAMVADSFCRSNPAFSRGLDFKILATDVDTNVLDKARAGVYAAESIRPVPAAYRLSCLERNDERVTILPHIQDHVTFRRFNLMHDFPFKYGFDVIFCRNVLIYFSHEDRTRIVKKFHASLRPGGHLILGHSESLLADSCGFMGLGNTIYRKT